MCLGEGVGKATSLNEIRRRCATFVANWRNEPGEERQQAQSFVRELFQAFGITARKAAAYEKRAQRSSTGRRGYIDALIPSLALVEMKSRGHDLVAAEQQALDYVDSLNEAEMPRWIITSDFANFRVLDLLAVEGEDVEEFLLEELPNRADALAFLGGYTVRSFGDAKQEQASIQAAKIMARLYEALGDGGYSDHDASVFLVRILFALYADDAGVWERDLFMEFIETRTNSDGTDLGPQLAFLFQMMNTPIANRSNSLDEMVARFPYVNGGIFAESARIPVFDTGMRRVLIEACEFNWAGISPAIFGSLFQAVKTAEARREMGEHYTTETNILKTIGPLFLDELREDYLKVLYDKAGLRRLRRRLAEMRFLDPACGCGNFLVVAYRELRQLDLDILTRLRELGDDQLKDVLFVDKEAMPITPGHFAGIEIEEWPAQIATTALHLVDHQANQAMELALGVGPVPLPLEHLTTIRVGNALRMDWTKIFTPNSDVIILGNPPFVGHKSKTRDQVADLEYVWGEQFNGYFDYVTGWYRKAADFFYRVPRGGRFAFVSTNSIAQGRPVADLFRPLLQEGWRIRFAHQTFAWTSEAPGPAAVHCVIVGFDKKERTPRQLFTYAHPKADPVVQPATNVNAYLLDAADLYIGNRSKPLGDVPEVQYGTMPIDGGGLLISPLEYDSIISDPIAAKYVRPFVGAKELIHNTRRWCLWLEGMPPSELNASPVLRERVEAVQLFRNNAPKGGDAYKYRTTPHLFRPNRSRPKTNYICIPAHFSETRRYATVAYFEPDVIAGNANFTASDPEGQLFAIISSSMYLSWQRVVGGALESRLRFSKQVVWNNLPLPDISEDLKGEVIEAGRGVLKARALHPAWSLADHYNPLAMDPKLVRAHDALDRVVDRAFGATKSMTTEAERQALLFKQYAKLIKGMPAT